ncbi:hypothetical protein MOQ_004577 [Trypanosoma cruzi marinkellei]|uniref:Uncharacterized protein n=1 Tax=Trypanosoma cruzi marinkellei TaxID=85056 RepID=K2M963_TRYCR|nr:hypothetical protein MOQ_004577 [Trypanosoma cruzi marinkellei]
MPHCPPPPFFPPLSCCSLVHLLHGLLGGGHLALSLVALCAAVLALKDGLAFVVELQLCDFHIGGMHTNGDGGAVRLLTVHLVDVNHPTEAVARRDLALTALVRATLHAHFIVLADGHGTHVVLCTELLRERGTHEDAAHMTRRLKVGAASLATASTLNAGHYQPRNTIPWRSKSIKKREDKPHFTKISTHVMGAQTYNRCIYKKKRRKDSPEMETEPKRNAVQKRKKNFLYNQNRKKAIGGEGSRTYKYGWIDG